MNRFKLTQNIIYLTKHIQIRNYFDIILKFQSIICSEKNDYPSLYKGQIKIKTKQILY